MNFVDIYILDLHKFNSDLFSSKMDISLKPLICNSKKRSIENLASDWLKLFVLKRYLGNQKIIFGITKRGRPFLKNIFDYDFNISHTNGYLVMAIAKNQRVGIDIQSFKQSVTNFLGISQKYYSKIEFQWLCGLSNSRAEHYFYLLWTLKEASLKRMGENIFLGLSKYIFIYKSNQLQLSKDILSPYRPYYYVMTINPGIFLSLAVSHPIKKIGCFVVDLNKDYTKKL